MITRRAWRRGQRLGFLDSRWAGTVGIQVQKVAKRSGLAAGSRFVPARRSGVGRVVLAGADICAQVSTIC